MSKALVDQFADWVRTKPVDEAYEYFSVCNCACGQFFDEMGLTEASDNLLGEPRLKIERKFMLELQALPRTFGALATRLAEQAA